MILHLKWKKSCGEIRRTLEKLISMRNEKGQRFSKNLHCTRRVLRTVCVWIVYATICQTIYNIDFCVHIHTNVQSNSIHLHWSWCGNGKISLYQSNTCQQFRNFEEMKIKAFCSLKQENKNETNEKCCRNDNFSTNN